MNLRQQPSFIDRPEHAVAQLNINSRVANTDAEADTPLLWVLRDHLGLTGTKYGCGVAQCGACTVHVDGAALRSCVVPVSAIPATAKVVTIEGLGSRWCSRPGPSSTSRSAATASPG